MEALWPEQSPARLGNRLSVLLSTVRTVLDPEKRFEADHFVAADRGSLWLQARAPRRRRRAISSPPPRRRSRRCGRTARARARTLIAAEAAYSGDFLEEDAYEEWALPLREEARAVYTEVARALAETRPATGTPTLRRATTCACSSAIPSTSPPTSGSSPRSRRAGRHGEARRRFRAYCARMETIGVESASFPAEPAITQP